MAQHEDWKKAPPYSCGPEPFLAQYRAQCYCGAVAFEVSAEPVDSKVCHCRRCQSLHGAPFQWAVIFEKPHVRFVRGVEKIFFYNADTGGINCPGAPNTEPPFAALVGTSPTVNWPATDGELAG